MSRPEGTYALIWLLAGVAVLLLVLHFGPDYGPERAKPIGELLWVGRLTESAISESSGVIASRRHKGAYWTMNDSLGGTCVYAVDAKGKLLGKVRLAGAPNSDWENIAIDSAGNMEILQIYGLAEPSPVGSSVAGVTLKRQYRYPKRHGRLDCEAMFVRKGWAYLISKEIIRARLFRVHLAGDEDKPATAEYLGVLPDATWVTGADISPDGLRLALVKYGAVFVYDLPAPIDELVSDHAGLPVSDGAFAARPLRQGAVMGLCEAICWTIDDDGGALLITNEGGDVFRLSRRPP